MVKLINRNSFIVLSVILMGGAWWLAGRAMGPTAGVLAGIAIGVALFLVFRSTIGPMVPATARTTAAAAAGKHTLVEYYSDF